MRASQEADWLDQPTPTPHPDAAALLARIDAATCEPSTIRAPWTDEQVAGLAEWQNTGWLHPYTCPNRGDGNHVTTTDLGVLTPTPDGWRCASCDYQQDWAHHFGALPVNPFLGGAQ